MLNDSTQDWEGKLTLLHLPGVVAIALLWLLLACLIFFVAICFVAMFYAISYSVVYLLYQLFCCSIFCYICYISCFAIESFDVLVILL